MKPAARKRLLGISLALTVVATLAISREPQQPTLAEAVTKAAPAAGTQGLSAKSTGQLQLAELKRPPMEVSEANPFAPKSWYTPPPPPTARDDKPVVPPLPFSYKGKLGEDGDRQIFYLAKGEESFVVAVGDAFANTYKLESARDGALVIKYLPLGATQTLRYGPDL